jgi:hypothetical protein
LGEEAAGIVQDGYVGEGSDTTTGDGKNFTHGLSLRPWATSGFSHLLAGEVPEVISRLKAFPGEDRPIRGG